jgi:hypothetical protein
MNSAHEALSEFPIKRSAEQFEKFFDGKRRLEGVAFVRRDMYSEAGVRALRCVQPFALSEEAAALGVEWSRDSETEYRYHFLGRLHALSVIDKHRRLPALTWTADLMYWSDVPEGQSYGWRPAQGLTEFADGALIGHFVNVGGTTPPELHPNWAMHLTFDDDPGGRTSNFADTLENWCRSIESWTIPRMAVVAEGNPPPLGFF